MSDVKRYGSSVTTRYDSTNHISDTQLSMHPHLYVGLPTNHMSDIKPPMVIVNCTRISTIHMSDIEPQLAFTGYKVKLQIT